MICTKDMKNIMQEEVECCDALGEAALNDLPFLVGDDAGNEVEGEDALRTLSISVDGEGDALFKEAGINQVLFVPQILDAKAFVSLMYCPVVGKYFTAIEKHFVKEAVFLVALKHR